MEDRCREYLLKTSCRKSEKFAVNVEAILNLNHLRNLCLFNDECLSLGI
jgi:hypothetical protein